MIKCAPSEPGRVEPTLKLPGPNPNAGLLEAAFAGALGVRLGGPLSYAGRAQLRPTLGDGAAPDTAAVRRAVRLSLAVGATATVACAAVAR